MSRKDKLLARLLSRSTDFTWDEAVTLMKHHGFVVLNGDGSRRKFFHQKTRTKVLIHKPHPENVVKLYAQDDLIDGLKKSGEIQ